MLVTTAIFSAREAALLPAAVAARLTEAESADLDRVVEKVNEALRNFNGGDVEVRLAGISKRMLCVFCQRCRAAGWAVEKSPVVGAGKIAGAGGRPLPQVVGWVVVLSPEEEGAT